MEFLSLLRYIVLQNLQSGASGCFKGLAECFIIPTGHWADCSSRAAKAYNGQHVDITFYKNPWEPDAPDCSKI